MTSQPDPLAASAALISDGAYADGEVPRVNARQAEARYGEERARRLRDDGNKQYIDLSISDKFRYFQDDPWVDSNTVNDVQSMFPEGKCQVLILGAGFGGLLYAIRMIQAGVHAGNIRIVDTAGGFGGTWYWNRYPGLGCDIESYCYLPLLEEMGYVPRHRLSTGAEIREYAELIARRWNLTDSAVFKTKAQQLEWNDEAMEWHAELVQDGDTQQPKTVKIRSSFVATVNGVLNWPKLPDLPGLTDFGGRIFHSSRWDYQCTGGSPTDASLTKLQDKHVAIVGTGCSGAQIVPHLARWSKKLYVVQRTPASVDVKDQRETHQDWFRNQVANTKGWQRERMRNYHQQFTTGELPAVNLVNDSFTRARGMVAVAGNPQGIKTMEELPAYLQRLHEIDLERQNCIRHRVAQTVKDPKVADKLQAWYPTWCKRPVFSDDYLPTFSRDNVTLLDTDGKGMDGLNADSIIVNGEAYPVDVVIFATGYRAPFTGTPAEKANMKIIGRNGVSMTDAWAEQGPSTMHGVMDHNFPNLFLSGPWQASLSPNNLFNTDELAKHAAYILGESLKKAPNKAIAISPTQEATQAWGLQILMHAAPMAAAVGCTPNYFNVEGELDRIPPEAQMMVARSGLWGLGIEDFALQLAAWRAGGAMQGVEVRS